MGKGERLPLTRHGLRDVIGEGAGFGNIIKGTLGGEGTSGPQGIIFLIILLYFSHWGWRRSESTQGVKTSREHPGKSLMEIWQERSALSD